MYKILLVSVFLLLAMMQTPILLAQEWHNNGPFGADVLILDQPEWDSGKILAGTRFDGLYIKNLGDSRWLRFAAGLPKWAEGTPLIPEDDYSSDVTVWGGDYPPVYSFATMAGNPNYLLVGLGQGLYRSLDGGETFDVIFRDTDTMQQVRQVWIMPGDPDYILLRAHPVTGESRLYFTNTSGFEWIEQPYRYVTGFAVDPFNVYRIFMFGNIDADSGTDCGMYVSNNGGFSWAPQLESLTYVNDLSPSPVDEGVWVGIGGTESSEGIFYTRDNFETITFIDNSSDAVYVEFNADGNVLTHVPTRGTTLMQIELPESGSEGVWSTLALNAGYNALSPQASEIKNFYSVHGDTDRLYAATTFGVVCSEDGGQTAEWLDEGLNNARVDHILASPTLSHAWYAYGVGGAWVTVDDGNNWSRVAACKTWGLTLDPNCEAVMLACDGAVHTSDGTLQPFERGRINGSGKKLIYAGEDTIWAVDSFQADPHTVRYTTNFGETWEQGFNFEISTEVHLADDANGNLLLAGNYMMRVGEDVSEPEWIDLPGIATSCMASFPDPSRILITVANNFYESTTGGASWSSYGSQLAPHCTNGKTMGAIKRDGESDAGLYALIRGEDLYHRIAIGNPWIHVDTPEELDWRTIDFAVNRDTLLAIATHSKGIWIRGGIISDAGEEDGNRAAPVEYRLTGPYPNPFNLSTSFEIALPQAAPITLRVYDLQGRLVETLINRTLMAGETRTTWNADIQASGTYFVRLNTPWGQTTRKIVLLR